MYYRMVCELVEAPDVRRRDLVSIAAAAELLGTSIASVNQYLYRGRLTTIVDDAAPPTAHKRARRMLLRAEVEALRAEREVGQAEEDDQG